LHHDVQLHIYSYLKGNTVRYTQDVRTVLALYAHIDEELEERPVIPDKNVSGFARSFWSNARSQPQKEPLPSLPNQPFL